MWKQSEINLNELNALSKDTLGATLQILFTEIGPDYLQATMPVGPATHQPLGLLHGGATAALAETLGSVASWLCIDSTSQIAVGMNLECSHLRGKRKGFVTGTATPLHLGSTTHVWDIKVRDEGAHLIAACKLTVAILKRKVP